MPVLRPATDCAASPPLAQALLRCIMLGSLAMAAPLGGRQHALLFVQEAEPPGCLRLVVFGA
jgi:hypothetical protein